MRPLALAFAAPIMFTLAACSNVGNVNNKWCDPVAPERLTLSADALFAFDRSNERDLLPEGRKTLDELAYKLSNNYATVDAITLTGHTDRIGSADYNMRLGQARANTVRSYLVSHGVRAPIKTASAGKNSPVTNGCHTPMPWQDLKACLGPDRRVTVDIIGAKKVR